MDWYSKIEFQETTTFEQGDFISDCPFYEISFDKNGNSEASISFFNVVIMTQSCDLENEKTDRVLVAPWESINYHLCNYLATLQKGSPTKEFLNKNEKIKFFNNLKQGIYHRYHILEKIQEIDDYPIIDFANTYSISLKELKSIALNQKELLRLNSPYKEHLSQAFARYFMRVGLPTSIKNPFE